MPCTPLPRFLVSSVIFLIGLVGIGVPAASAAVQNNAVPNRINSQVSNGSEVAIPDSIHPRARLADDLGPAAANTRLQGMSIRFSRTADQEAALDQLLVDLQDPNSPRYHQWLTPAQFGAQFGLSTGDIAKVTAWLTGQGFTVTGVAQGGSFVTFDGTVAQAQAAFGTSIHNLSVDGVTHFANVTDAQLPSAFANVVSGITGLHDFRLKPRVHASAVKPNYTSSVSSNHYLAPGDLYAIYDMNPLLTAGINGTGVTIAVMGQVQVLLTDVTAFRAAAGLSVNLPTLTPVPGRSPAATSNCSAGSSSNCPSPNLDDLAESSLDVQWSGAMAPAATILYVEGVNIINDSMTYAVDQNLAPIITISYGNCEAGWGATELNILNQLFKQANAQGQTILAATADVGATDCDNGASAIEGLTVDFPASSPYVTGVGGTMFNEGNAAGATTYWNSPDTTFVAGTAVPAADVSAKGYIPETTWNEDSPGSFFSAGGGGVSAFFSKPAWQVETGAPGMTTSIPTDASRDLPDISLDAASVHDPFLYCAQGSCTSGFRNASSTLTVAGGTSFDSQIFGGMLALVEQKIGGRIGNANPKLYAMGNAAAYYNATGASVFHDVTSGNNSNPCTAGTPSCPYGGTIGYSATTGYDLATGWGSVDLNNLANAWAAVTALGSGSLGSGISSTALTASVTSVAAGSTVTLTATVSGSTITSVFPATLTTTPGATPAGTVQFLVNNVIVGSGLLDPSGVAKFTYASTCSALGQQNMTASYTGSSTYAGSTGPVLPTGGAGSSTGAGISSNGSVITTPVIVNVTAGSTCPYYSLTPGNASVGVSAGATIPTSTITVAPLNGFIGTVTFTASSTSTSGYLPSLSFNPATITFTSANNTASQSTVLTLSGITANLRLPNLPGQVDSGIQMAQHSDGRKPWYAAGSGVTIASLILLVLPRRRRLGGLLVLALSAVLIGGAGGCGASSQTSITTPANSIYAGTYVINVIGTYTSGSQVTRNSTAITYNIQ